MFTPISRAILITLLLAGLAGCGGNENSPEEKESGVTKRDASDGKVDCALAGSDYFERTCSTEQIRSDGVTVLIIRHPDGGFRRFNVLTDGRGVAPSDGFDETRIRLLEDNMIELTSGDDKYRLPAQINASNNNSASSKDAS